MPVRRRESDASADCKPGSTKEFYAVSNVGHRNLLVYVGFGILHHGQRRPAVHRQLAGHLHYGQTSSH